MKKRFSLIFVVILAVIAVATLAACNSGGKIPDASPVKWQTYLDEINDMTVDSVDFSDGVFSLQVQGIISYGDKSFELYTGLNYDSQNSGNSMLIIDLTQLSVSVFSIKADNENSYVYISPNDVLGDAKIKLTDVNLFSWLNKTLNADSANDGSALKEILKNAGLMFFDNVDVNADKSLYSFKLSNELWQAESAKYFNALTSVLSENAKSALFSIFGAKDEEAFLAVLPQISGNIDFSVADKQVTTIKSSRLEVDGTDASFTCSVSASGGLIEALGDRFPTSDDGYNVTKTASFGGEGEVSLYSVNGNKRSVTYDYELNVNMDLFEFALNDYDLSALSDDNFFHLRISHKCDGYCTSFCKSKLNWESGGTKGAILDVAFSPSDFGNSNLFFVVNLKAVMGTSFFNKLNSYPGDITKSTLPEYCLFTMSAQDVKNNTSLADAFIGFYLKLCFSDEGFDLPVEDVTALTDGSALAHDLINNFFKSEREYDNDVIRVDVNESRFGQVTSYDVYKQAIYIVSDTVSDTKKFYTDLLGLSKDTRNAAIDWEYEAAVTADTGEVLNNVYDESGNLIHGVSNGAYVPLSPKEAGGLTKNYLKASFTDIYKETVTDKYMRIVAVDGIDYLSRFVQRVKLTVQRPNHLQYMFLSNLFEEYGDSATAELYVNIKLTDETAFSFTQQADAGKEYRLTYHESSVPEILLGTANISYSDGSVKSIPVTGKSDAVNEYWYIKGISAKLYSVNDWGAIKVVFDVANRIVNKTFSVKAPERFEFNIDQRFIQGQTVGESFGISPVVAFAKLFAYYGETKVQIALSESDYFINDIPLSKNSSVWEVSKYLLTDNARAVFYVANEYPVTIRKHGLISELFTLSVKAKQSNPPEYSYTPSTSVQDFYFTNVDYDFKGTIKNSLHGETDDTMKSFNVQVYPGSVNSKGVVTFDKNEADDAVVSRLIALSSYLSDANSFKPPHSFDVPALIINGLVNSLNVTFRLNFREGGYFRILFSMSGGDSKTVTHEWKIFVDSNPST